MSATRTDQDPANVVTYCRTPAVMERMPAAMAVLALANRVAEALGTGAWDDEAKCTDGILDTPVHVTIGGIYGEQRSVTIDTGEGTTVLIDDDTYPLQQLQALLEQLRRHTIAGDLRAECGSGR